MIFYFSGTGNSLYVAKNIADLQGEKLLSIAKEVDGDSPGYEYEMHKGELLGFVFPIYAWAPPRMLLDFIRKIKLTGEKPFAFYVSTCGDEEGYTKKIMQNELSKKGISLECSFTLKMPNNYMLGVDLDSKEVQAAKLRQAAISLRNINGILKRRKGGIGQVMPGKLPGMKSYFINPMFQRFSMGTKNFRADEKCTGCGICEKVCPIHSIKVSGRPAWSSACTRCLACINSCPEQSIQYGKGTMNRGRYLHPDLKRNPLRQHT